MFIVAERIMNALNGDLPFSDTMVTVVDAVKQFQKISDQKMKVLNDHWKEPWGDRRQEIFS